ncbi:MAG TPA: hypothetical protein VK464_13445, partial [Symbiobacteriaceae bacterium]|nr:hypothetical protein [Symbiobacteriaceae bacterium]
MRWFCIDVRVPAALLFDRELTSSAKLVWMLCQMHAGASPPLASNLAAQSGLTTATVRAALAQVGTIQVPAGPSASLPGPLVTDPKVPPVAKVLYGILQSQNGEFTYPALSRLTGTGPNTLKRAVAALVQAEWLETEQRNRLASVSFTLRNPILARQQLEVELARRRLQRAPHKGEALMKEYLSLLVDSNEFEDNARPGFLINPKSRERLELDRFYTNTAAFEYNGASHFGTTEEAIDQQTRDMVKVGICALRQIPVVVIQSGDLSLAGMRAKIGRLLPLRDLAGH